MQPLWQHCSTTQVPTAGVIYPLWWLHVPVTLHTNDILYTRLALTDKQGAAKPQQYFSSTLSRKIKQWRRLTCLSDSQVFQLQVNSPEWGKQVKAYLCTSAEQDRASPQAPSCRCEWDLACNLPRGDLWSHSAGASGFSKYEQWMNTVTGRKSSRSSGEKNGVLKKQPFNCCMIEQLLNCSVLHPYLEVFTFALHQRSSGTGLTECGLKDSSSQHGCKVSERARFWFWGDCKCPHPEAVIKAHTDISSQLRISSSSGSMPWTLSFIIIIIFNVKLKTPRQLEVQSQHWISACFACEYLTSKHGQGGEAYPAITRSAVMKQLQDGTHLLVLWTIFWWLCQNLWHFKFNFQNSRPSWIHIFGFDFFFLNQFSSDCL